MSRRATYMYGSMLPPGPKGHVDAGLGKTVSVGSVNLVPPTTSICETGQTLTVDGVEIEFQVTPDTEAPAEMNFYFPQFKALCMAENCSCHLHNIITPRGAQVRDAKSWSYYINEAIDLYASRTDVMFASHHWPRWGEDVTVAFLEKQRDLYKYVHDQTLRLANHGLTPLEIAEDFRLPPTLEAEWYTRGYYGTLSHNTKAIYQRYLGWFDGNPANLHKWPPAEAGKRYVAAIGGADAVLKIAQTAYDEGDYRWVAELVNHLVFAEPGIDAARALQANALEQMGYQAESGPWRSFYLTAAQELRNPRAPAAPDAPRTAGQETVRGLPTSELLDSLSVRLNGLKAGAKTITLNLNMTDTNETYLVTLTNGVLHHEQDKTASNADASISLPRLVLAALALKEKSVSEVVADGTTKIEGNADALADLLDLLDTFDFWFEIVMP